MDLQNMTQNTINLPSYTALMSVYKNDRAEWVKDAVNSILNQSFRPSAYVIVEDGPVSEDIENILNDFHTSFPDIIKIIRLEQNSGLGNALNKGLAECKTEWVARQDADDISEPSRIEKELKIALTQNADIVSSSFNEFMGTPDNVVSVKTYPTTHDEIYKYAKRRNPFAHPSVVYRKSKVLDAGGYDPDAYLHEDYDLFTRMLMKGSIGANSDEVLLNMRVNEDFYKRRGGRKYLKTLLKFNKKLYKSGFTKFSDYFIRSCANIVSCLMPSALRKSFYKKALRNK